MRSTSNSRQSELSLRSLNIGGQSLTATPNQLNPLGAASAGAATGRIIKIAGPIALAAVDTGGGVLSWANPESTAIIVQRVTLDVTTKATGACTVDVGTTATSATTSSNNLLTGVDVGTATGTFDNLQNPGGSGKPTQRLAAGKWVTASKASGASAGLVGNAYIEYVMV